MRSSVHRRECDIHVRVSLIRRLDLDRHLDRVEVRCRDRSGSGGSGCDGRRQLRGEVIRAETSEGHVHLKGLTFRDTLRKRIHRQGGFGEHVGERSSSNGRKLHRLRTDTVSGLGVFVRVGRLGVTCVLAGVIGGLRVFVAALILVTRSCGVASRWSLLVYGVRWRGDARVREAVGELLLAQLFDARILDLHELVRRQVRRIRILRHRAPITFRLVSVDGLRGGAPKELSAPVRTIPSLVCGEFGRLASLRLLALA